MILAAIIAILAFGGGFIATSHRVASPWPAICFIGTLASIALTVILLARAAAAAT